MLAAYRRRATLLPPFCIGTDEMKHYLLLDRNENAFA
jgi:hypothetical protein